MLIKPLVVRKLGAEVIKFRTAGMTLGSLKIVFSTPKTLVYIAVSALLIPAESLSLWIGIIFMVTQWFAEPLILIPGAIVIFLMKRVANAGVWSLPTK